MNNLTARPTETTYEESNSAAALFERDRYLFCAKLLDQTTCELATQYALFDKTKGFAPEEEAAQVPGSHSKYADPLMESLLDIKKPDIERIVGLKLIPSYSYHRVYQPGQVLERHKDRPSCEVSVSLCLGYEYQNVSEDYSWPLWVGPGTGETGAIGNPICCESGDGLIYRGCEVEHWRERLMAGPDSFHVQVFLHYVDASGPFATVCAFDGRPALGLPQSTKDPAKAARAKELDPNAGS